MPPKLFQVVALVSTLLVARILFYVVANPINVERTALMREIEQIPGSGVAGVSGLDYAAIQNTIMSRPALWSELVSAPPLPPEPPLARPVPEAPDLTVLLKGVTVERGQIGDDKVRLVTPDAPKGAWFAKGTQINGCVLESFTEDVVKFTYEWKEGGKKLSLNLPRP